MDLSTWKYEGKGFRQSGHSRRVITSNGFIHMEYEGKGFRKNGLNRGAVSHLGLHCITLLTTTEFEAKRRKVKSAITSI